MTMEEDFQGGHATSPGTMEVHVDMAGLFNNGLGCGYCFEMWCDGDPELCLPGTITVTAISTPLTLLCRMTGGWCNPPLQHFDMTKPAFLQIARYRAGIVPISLRSPMHEEKRNQVHINGRSYFNLVLITNVGGSGYVHSMSIMGSKRRWQAMSRNWGQNWQNNTYLDGQSLSYQVTASNGKTLTSYNLVPENWQFGQTFDDSQS
ncbi:Expansin-A8 [Hibiscus syriacus]|uniref:Expansin n=1 Tax=Hibiscus syriacus TaxID=106335 RepID=A0A6A2YGZ1_HIBSY|nr:Expansin-A8 [Hibiscus syriacus]